MNLEVASPILSFNIGSFVVNITRDIIVQWVIILMLFIIACLLTRNLKRVPTKKQVVLESLYKYVEGLVTNNVGESYTEFIPYVGTIVVYLICLNFSGLVGVEPATSNLSVTFGLALTSFLVINITALRKNGAIGYVKAFGQPYVLMLPINIMERVVLPVSLALRLYGNMFAGSLLIGLIYEALCKIAVFASIGLPIIVHAYFDIFDGAIQMLVFTMLTIINLKTTVEHH